MELPTIQPPSPAIATPSFVTYMTSSPRACDSPSEGSAIGNHSQVAKLKHSKDLHGTSPQNVIDYSFALRTGSRSSTSTSDSGSEPDSSFRLELGDPQEHKYGANEQNWAVSHVHSSSTWGNSSLRSQDELEDDDIEEACQLLANALRARRHVHNLCAGPAGIPNRVLTQFCHDILNFENSGIGVEEMSHRDPDGPVQRSLSDTCGLIRELLDVPASYEVLLMQGGAHAQFSALPFNLLKHRGAADYIDGGFWSRRAQTEAKKLCDARLVPGMRENAKTGKLEYIPPSEWALSPDAGYVHICANETINGLEFLSDPELPDTDARPLVADFTSTFLSRPIDVSKYGVIYASGGKNLGPAGVCVVIVRRDLIGQRELAMCPSVMSYATAAGTSPIPNVYNTPNMLSVRAVQLMLEQVQRLGGVAACSAVCKRRAESLYAAIDASGGFYSSGMAAEWRSCTTIPFNVRGGDAALEALFRSQAEAVGLYQIFGHHSVGGLRVCLYNAVREASVDLLLRFMASFQREHA